MKIHHILCTVFVAFFTKFSFAQTTQGSIQNTGQANAVQVMGNPSQTLTNVRFSSFSVAISIPHQSQPPVATIAVNSLPHLNWTQLFDSDFDGRDFYVFLGILDINNNTNVTWPAGQSNPILKIQFTGGVGSQIVQLNDLTGQNGGLSQQVYWYVELLGTGDITDYNAPFYASPGSGMPVNISGGNSFVPTLGVVALPLELTDFQAEKLGDEAVRLIWRTENEVAFSHFELQKSPDGVSWASFASVGAKGGPNGRENYSFDDQSPFGGVNYYRLKMLDNDGSASFSAIREVFFDKKPLAQVYPNPASNGFWVHLPDQLVGEKMEIRLFDMTGRVVYSNIFIPEDANNVWWVDLTAQGLKAGSYLAEFSDNAGSSFRLPLVLLPGL